MLCKKRNINYICYDRAKTKSTANFNLNNPSPIWDISKPFLKEKKQNFPNYNENKMKQLLKSREQHKGDVYQYNKAAVLNNIDKLKSKLGIEKKQNDSTLFLNLPWDAANINRDIIFKTHLKW